MGLQYTEGRASEQDIYSHLMKCDEDFVPHLHGKVDIQEYSTKISEKAVTFEAWSGDALVGLVAAYFNDPRGEAGYITNVSTLKAHLGKGIASRLINLSIEYARQRCFKNIFLEVEKANQPAVSLYKKLHFQEVEDRPSATLMKLEVSTRTV